MLQKFLFSQDARPKFENRKNLKTNEKSEMEKLWTLMQLTPENFVGIKFLLEHGQPYKEKKIHY